MEFKIESKFKPAGDQPEAIETLVKAVQDGIRTSVLLGVTGSGKTFTMANVIKRLQRPTLVLAHNKTLAAQLCSELKEFFPQNAVEYFVSFYDYYQPEAYIPSTDTYIEKDMSRNEEIDKMRHSATSSLFERRDVIVVASVSCIYGLGDPAEYQEMSLHLRPGMKIERNRLLQKLVSIQYERNDVDFSRGTFRVRGDIVEIFPSNSNDTALRVELFGDEIERLSEMDVVTGQAKKRLAHAAIFPNTHYVAAPETLARACEQIIADLGEQAALFKEQNKLIEEQRITQRVTYDVEMMRELGYCSGIENYSRYLDGRNPGEAPYTLLDYFPDDFLLIVDESHVSLPQVRGMYAGDRSRKEKLVDYGFRLPSAYDNRPLNFDEFLARVGQMICCSATPADLELSWAGAVAEQIVRPTGLLDPEITVVPTEGQIDHLLGEIHKVIGAGRRVLVTTLTKKMAEMLTDYLMGAGIKARYMHSEVETLERMQILRDLRLGEFDVLVGINLLREGLDLPEVSLVAILDADKEGFLRSERSLVQTIGRAARNAEGRVIMYADNITESMRRAISETNRRRQKQEEYNKAHGIVPQTIIKPVSELLEIALPTDKKPDPAALKAEVLRIEREMLEAARKLEFEKAAKLRDQLKGLRSLGL